jgi:hypothetical protein
MRDMKHFIAFAGLTIACLVLPASLQVVASEMVGIYAIVDKVVFEPDEKSPVRIQIWGTFVTNRDATPKRGYMYFKLPGAFPPQDANEAAKKEWADLKAVAKTGQAVAFGRRFFPFVQQKQANDYFQTLGRVRSAADPPASPDAYPVNIGLSKVSDSATVNKLKGLK